MLWLDCFSSKPPIQQPFPPVEKEEMRSNVTGNEPVLHPAFWVLCGSTAPFSGPAQRHSAGRLRTSRPPEQNCGGWRTSDFGLISTTTPARQSYLRSRGRFIILYGYYSVRITLMPSASTPPGVSDSSCRASELSRSATWTRNRKLAPFSSTSGLFSRAGIATS
jgi:hypothetical protein